MVVLLAWLRLTLLLLSLCTKSVFSVFAMCLRRALYVLLLRAVTTEAPLNIETVGAQRKNCSVRETRNHIVCTHVDVPQMNPKKELGGVDIKAFQVHECIRSMATCPAVFFFN